VGGRRGATECPPASVRSLARDEREQFVGFRDCALTRGGGQEPPRAGARASDTIPGSIRVGHDSDPFPSPISDMKSRARMRHYLPPTFSGGRKSGTAAPQVGRLRDRKNRRLSRALRSRTAFRRVPPNTAGGARSIGKKGAADRLRRASVPSVIHPNAPSIPRRRSAGRGVVHSPPAGPPSQLLHAPFRQHLPLRQTSVRSGGTPPDPVVCRADRAHAPPVRRGRGASLPLRPRERLQRMRGGMRVSRMLDSAEAVSQDGGGIHTASADRCRAGAFHPAAAPRSSDGNPQHPPILPPVERAPLRSRERARDRGGFLRDSAPSAISA